MAGWTLWHDVALYHALDHSRLGGAVYGATTYDTERACQAGQRDAMADEEQRRRGALTQRVVDGVIVWDAGLAHYTAFRYRCTENP